MSARLCRIRRIVALALPAAVLSASAVAGVGVVGASKAPAFVDDSTHETDARLDPTWERLDAWTVDLSGDWTGFVRSLGVPVKRDLGLEGSASETKLSPGSVVSLPSDDEHLTPADFRMEAATNVVVPHFDEHMRVTGHHEGLLWRGRADNSTAILAFAREQDQSWSLGSGVIADEQGSVRHLSADSGTVRLTRVGNNADTVSVEATPADVGQRGVASASRVALPSPRAVNVGTKYIDLLAVGFSHPSQLVSPNNLLTRTLAGIGSFNTTMDNSSSTNWDIDGITARLKGLMTMETAAATGNRDDDLAAINYYTVPYYVAQALGVDVIAGHRNEYPNDQCGKALEYDEIFVWQRGGGSGDDCQADESYTFAHELIHILNGEHSHAVTQQQSPQSRTLMSTGSPSEDRVLYISNPDVLFPFGSWPREATGVAGQDNNAERVAGRVAAVAGKRSPASPSTAGRYTPMEFPERVLDTRNGLGGHTDVRSTSTRQVSVLTSSVPATAKAVALNVVVISGSGDQGGLRITPDSGSATLAQSAMLFQPNDVRAQTVVVDLSTYRAVYMRTTADVVEVVVDVIGYFGGTGQYMHALNDSQRIFDGTITGGAGNSATVDLSSACTSTSTTAAFVNIVAVAPGASGFAIARGYYNALETDHSTLNYLAGDVIANGTFVEVDARKFKLYSSSTTRYIVDVFGCFTTSSSGGTTWNGHSTPKKIQTSATLGANGAMYRNMGGSTGGASLWTANVTANTSSTFVWAKKPLQANPPTSNINLTAGDYISNTSLTPTTPSGSNQRIYIRRGGHSGTTTLQVIELGYFD